MLVINIGMLQYDLRSFFLFAASIAICRKWRQNKVKRREIPCHRVILERFFFDISKPYSLAKQPLLLDVNYFVLLYNAYLEHYRYDKNWVMSVIHLRCT
jgi:hypothetical protein